MNTYCETLERLLARCVVSGVAGCSEVASWTSRGTPSRTLVRTALQVFCYSKWSINMGYITTEKRTGRTRLVAWLPTSSSNLEISNWRSLLRPLKTPCSIEYNSAERDEGCEPRKPKSTHRQRPNNASHEYSVNTHQVAGTFSTVP